MCSFALSCLLIILISSARASGLPAQTNITGTPRKNIPIPHEIDGNTFLTIAVFTLVTTCIQLSHRSKYVVALISCARFN